MRYVVPVTAVNVTALCCVLAVSSFVAIGVNAPTAPPVYTASVVSNTLPAVVICIWPPEGAVQLHHNERPPVLPAWFGSPVSREQPTLDVRTGTAARLSGSDAANTSLAGRATTGSDVLPLNGVLPGAVTATASVRFPLGTAGTVVRTA
jgi:hypothetical protein